MSKSSLMGCVPRQPTKAQKDRLVETYARYKESMQGPFSVQTRAYGAYMKALNPILKRLCADSLSDENRDALDHAADRWLRSRIARGSGGSW